MGFFQRLFGTKDPDVSLNIGEPPMSAENGQAYNSQSIERGHHDTPSRSSGPSPEALQFIEAAASGDADTVTRLLGAGLPVDSLGKDSETALHASARNGHVRIVHLLLTSGANMETVSAIHDHTPLLEALDPKHYQDARDRTHYQDTQYKVVKCLLKRGANVLALTRGGDSALDYAAKYCLYDLDKRLVELILFHGADRTAALERYEKESSKWKREMAELFRTVSMAGEFVPGSDGERRRQELIALLKSGARSTNRSEITEIRLNKSHRMKIGMDNGLDATCPNCASITRHELATPDSVRCVRCRRSIALVWV